MRALRVSYPAFYTKLGEDDFSTMVDLWSTIFSGDDSRVVTLAVRDLIQTHTGFPPEIADVRKKITDIVRSATGEPTDEEYWMILRNALSDGIWGAKDNFEKLPAPLKRFCGSPSWIRDHARMSSEVIDSVIHGQFLKQFPRVKEAQEYHDSLPEAVRQAIGRLYSPMQEERTMDMFEFNDARNRVLDVLEGA